MPVELPPTVPEFRAEPIRTQPWNYAGRVDVGDYQVERVTFASGNDMVVGNLFVPSSTGQKPAVALIGPVDFVKEQAPIQYASRLACDGFVALVFDPRTHGESSGMPRRYENGRMKTDDLKAALDMLASRDEVDRERLCVAGICQGVNWAMQAAIEDRRVRALALVAGNYLTAAFGRAYAGSEGARQERIAQARKARDAYEAAGVVGYMPIVSDSDPSALLTARPPWEFYRRWSDRGPAWNFHGLWENCLTRMSGTEIWDGHAEDVISQLRLPTMMVHADQAANGPAEPRALFKMIAAARKQLVWLDDASQMQFYEDPITIDRAVHHLASWFRSEAP